MERGNREEMGRVGKARMEWGWVLFLGGVARRRGVWQSASKPS